MLCLAILSLNLAATYLWRNAPTKIPIIKVVTTPPFHVKVGEHSICHDGHGYVPREVGESQVCCLRAVAQNAKHDLLFLWTLRFLVGIVSYGIAADIWKKLREFFTTVCVDSFLFFDVWIGSLCSLFFSGVISALISVNRLDSSFPFRVGSPALGWGTKPKSLSSDQSTLFFFAAYRGHEILPRLIWGFYDPLIKKTNYVYIYIYIFIYC